MKKLLPVALLVALATIFALTAAGTALAASSLPAPIAPPPPPHGSLLVEDVSFTMTNWADSGNAAIWAIDNGLCHVQVWRTSPHHFYYITTESGVWTTFAGALSPDAGVPELAGGSGPYFAQWEETFQGTIIPGQKMFGYLGTHDGGETAADILGPQVGNTTTWDALTSRFDDLSGDNGPAADYGFNMLTWYGCERYGSQAVVWTATDGWDTFATTGDIVIPAHHCSRPG